MRVRNIALFFISVTLVFGASFSIVRAAQFYIHDVTFFGFPFIPNIGVYKYQTAYRAGDGLIFHALVRNPFADPPVSVSADLSSLGILSTTTEPSIVRGPDYNSDYYYSFGPFIVDESLPDGIKTVSVTAVSADGDVATSTASVAIDNVKPTISLSSAAFATTPPGGGDYVYVSGIVDGTGSVAAAGNTRLVLLDANHNQIDSFGSTQYMLSLSEAFASSTDGVFSNVPLQLLKTGVPDEVTIAKYLKIDTLVYDEAGNIATTSLTVAIPEPAPPDPCTTPGSCASNVFFLPGIEGSRLYRPDYVGGTDQLWEPNVDSDVKDLYMNSDGSSTRPDVYTKERDVIDELPSGVNIYKSFIAKMDELKTANTINDWEPVAYDWRLSLDDILNYGRNVQGRIYYSGDLRATSTPYVIQELRHLAATSKTGKVTIVAHSNGGLLAKRLTELLGSAESASLIDKMIFVAVPQAGTPAAIPAGLHGYEQDHVMGLVTSKSTARTFAQNSPMEYHLLPSASYFTYVDDPVVTFDSLLPDWIARYGSTIHSQSSLRQFLTDTYGRVDPQTGDINQPIQLNDSLLSGAETLHTSLDTWTPPAGIQLTQIAGWGVPKTVEGVIYKKKGAGVTPEADFTIDGDGTVVVPSALWTSTTTGTQNYFVDLKEWNRRFANTAAFGLLSTRHANIFEVPNLNQFVSDEITNTTKPLTNYSHISIEVPSTGGQRLRYALHSPLTLNLYDDQGRHTGVSTTTGQIEEQIPGTYYTEFGDVKYLFSDASANAQVIMNGYDTGTFTFNVYEYNGDTLTASTTFRDIPTTANTDVSLNIQSDITTLSPMQIDKNGDGTIDIILAPKLNDTVTLDVTPPEIRLTFSTTTKSMIFIGTDDSGTATVTATTTYPALKKKQKEYKGIATTTVIASDQAGNITALVYTERLPSPAQRDSIILHSISYNWATTTLSSAYISYKWRSNKNASFKLFASHLQTSSTRIESHYRPKNNKTILMTKPRDLDDSDNDDDSDVRPTKQTLPSMVIPYMMIKHESLIIGY